MVSCNLVGVDIMMTCILMGEIEKELLEVKDYDCNPQSFSNCLNLQDLNNC